MENLTIEQTQDNSLLARLNQQVQDLHHQWYPHLFKPFDEAQVSAFFSEILQKQDVWAFVARAEKEVIGFSVVIQKNYPESPFKYAYSSLYLDQIGVLAHHQFSGVGKRLIKHIEDFGREKGILQLETDHWTSNKNAAVFFKSQGFQYSRLMASKTLQKGKT